MPKPKTDRLNEAFAKAGLQPKTPPALEPPAPATQGASDASEPSSAAVEAPVKQQGGRPVKPDEEKATEKVTAYFTPEQYDKIEELQRAHRKRTKKRISVNELLRRLVVNASLEDILEF